MILLFSLVGLALAFAVLVVVVTAVHAAFIVSTEIINSAQKIKSANRGYIVLGLFCAIILEELIERFF